LHASTRATDLVGIARLAAASPLAQAKRGTEYYLLPVRTVLNRCTSVRVPFEWTVNPYRGCEFGCRYCYARYTHEYMELPPEAFERQIFVKQNAGAVFAADLGKRFPVHGTGGQPAEHIAIGAATDPYQPAEREFGVTRAILEQLAARSGLSISITTKSDQIVRDTELLCRIAARSELSINITVTTLRPRLARLLEPRAPRPDLRLAAVRRLREAGLAVGVFAMPVLPGLTDRPADLDALARAARDAGACWLGGQVLFLMPSSLKVFLPFLEKRFPRLARDYRRWYGRGGYAPEKYRQKISQVFAALRAKYGFAPRPYVVAAPAVASHLQSENTDLGFAVSGEAGAQMGLPLTEPQPGAARVSPLC
jgi:DNA repair photolyase